MTIGSVLQQKGSGLTTVSPTTTVQEITEIIAAKRIGAVLVLEDDGRRAGIVSEGDVVKAVAARPEGIDSMLARDVMTRTVTAASPRTTIEEAMEIMDHGYFRHLPVIEDNTASATLHPPGHPPKTRGTNRSVPIILPRPPPAPPGLPQAGR